MQPQTILLFGAFFGFTGIVLGAFGAHLLKKKLTENQLKSFETGVKYQIYHALLLLILGFQNTTTYSLISLFIVTGILLFSGSIYGLILSDAKGNKMKFLGPVTPIGGLLLLIGWALLFYSFL